MTALIHAVLRAVASEDVWRRWLLHRTAREARRPTRPTVGQSIYNAAFISSHLHHRYPPRPRTGPPRGSGIHAGESEAFLK